MTKQKEAVDINEHFQKEWLEEYQRLGNDYARRAAYIIIFSFPTIIFANYNLVNENNIAVYLGIYFAPSVIIAVTLLAKQFRDFRHEVLVFVMFASVFAAAAYRTDQETVLIYLITNAMCFIASSVQMLVFPKFNFVLFAYVIVLNVFVSLFFYGESLAFYLSKKGGVVVIVLGIVFIGVNQLRYKILKNNFINSLALKRSYELLAQKSRIIEANAKEIKAKNDDITASITYAERIQKAVLSNPETLKNLLPESFIFFKPRDIVSGDFYWFSEVEQKTVLAAVDCTGHGVPGAFMSMIGHDLLDKIINERKVTQPDLILNDLHAYIKKALKQDDGSNADGMDMTVVAYDEEKKHLAFAGAKNPLYYVENAQLKIIKGDKIPIGGLYLREKRMQHFTLHQIELAAQEQKTFYMFSDGYQDQFGGDQGKKFMVGKFKKLLLSIHDQPLEKQKNILEETLKKWQGKHEQIDDILIIGFRV